MQDKVITAWRRIRTSYTFSLLRSYLGLQIISQINSLVSLFFVAKYLGPENLGIISYAQYLAMLTVFVNSGIDTWSTYEFIRNNHDIELTSKIYNKSLRAKIFSAILGLSIIIPIAIIKSDNLFELQMYLVAIVMTTFSSTFLSLLNSYAVPYRMLPSMNRSAIFVSILILISRVLAVFMGAPAITFLFILTMDTTLTLSIFLYRNFKTLSENKIKLIPNYYRAKFTITNEFNNYIRIIWDAKYYLGIYIFSLLASRADLYTLKFYVDNHDLGIYSAAMRLAEYPGIISGIIGNVLLINLALGVKSKIRYGSIILGYLSNIILAILFIAIFAIFGKSIVNFIYGDRFIAVDKILLIYSFGIFGIFVNNFSSLIFMTHGKEKYLLYSSALGSIILIFLCHILIPRYGLIGAAAASSFTYIVISIFSVLAAFYTERAHKRGGGLL